MAVENTIVKNIYMGNGVTIEFPITFQIGDEHPEYVIVYITDTTGVIKETDNFTVNLEKKVVTYPKSGDPLPVGHKITVYRKLPLYQLLNLVNQGPFFAENIEAALDNITFMMQQLSENLNRTLSASVDIVNFNANFPVKAEMGIRINDAGDGLELTEDPAKVLPLAKAILKQTEQVKENTITETTQIKNETIDAKNTAVDAAETAAEDTVNKASEFLDGKVKAAALSANTAVEAANTAVSSAKNAATNASSAVESATTATEQADRAQHIADNLKGLEGLNGKATQEESEAGTSDDKVMTPLRVWDAIKKYMVTFLATAVFTGIVNAVTPEKESDGTEVPTTSWVRNFVSTALMETLVKTYIVQDYSMALTGYIRFGTWLGRLIIQWGNAVESNSDTDIKYFPISFTTNYIILTSKNYYYPVEEYVSWIVGVNMQGFLCGIGANFSAKPHVPWIAIGK